MMEEYGNLSKTVRMPEQRNAVRPIERNQRQIRPRIVIADDTPMSLGWIRTLLETRYDVVAEATNGLECVEAVKQFLPEVVVTDVTMPKMNGIEAARQITQKWPGVRVVMISVHDDPAFVDAAFEAGASGYVLKLAASDELIAAIDLVLEEP
jgi:DNA-binding NarL/FixJ family response regulator